MKSCLKSCDDSETMLSAQISVCVCVCVYMCVYVHVCVHDSQLKVTLVCTYTYCVIFMLNMKTAYGVLISLKFKIVEHDILLQIEVK